MMGFNLDHAPLRGRQWVEASAGSGKTWSIAGLYIRLLLEKKLKVENILVVTFTKAACAELKERLRDRIVDELSKRPEKSDEWLSLKLAEVNFDQARVLTIHGFCQMLLKEYAFESGVNFEWEVVGNEENLKEGLAQDFWRKKMEGVSLLWASWCQKNLRGPQALLDGKINKKIENDVEDGASYARGDEEHANFFDAMGHDGLSSPPIPVHEIEKAEEKFTFLWLQLKASWPVAHVELQKLLNHPSLNRKMTPTMRKALAAYNIFFSSPQPQAIAIKGAERLFADHVLKATKKNALPPQHDMFAKLKEMHEAQNHLTDMFRAKQASWLGEFERNVRQELPRLMEQQGVKSYDELLRGTKRVLQNHQRAKRLRASLQKRFSAVLMDECQDTDAVQFSIFRILYPPGDTPVYLVGDPKQSIYKFRGANVAAYLQEAESCEGHHTLVQNFRSSPKLIAALNALFKEDSFCTPGIKYRPAVPAGKIKDGVITQNNEAWPAMCAWLVGGENSSTIIDVGKAKNLLCQASAAAVSTWLEGNVKLNGQPLKAQDIAILVNRNDEADMMREALTQLNIPCTTRGTTQVTKTKEAEQWRRLLVALANPEDLFLYRSALSTILWGRTAEELATNDLGAELDTSLASDYDALYQLAQILLQDGVLALWRALIARPKVMERILAEGERCYVNLQHLAELLEDHSKKAGRDATMLAHWLADVPASDDFNLRLSSDEKLLSIFTIHGAKGLEFPIVLCPFTWHAKKSTDSDPDDEQDDFAENMRKLYVALTRAQHHCVLVWGPIKNCHKTPLGHLLHGTCERPPTFAEANEALEQWRKTSEGAVLVEVLREPQADKWQTPPRHLVMPEAISSLSKKQRTSAFWLNSFTRLSNSRLGSHMAGEIETEFAGKKIELANNFRQDFPRGSQAGSCLHELLQALVQERINFAESDWKKIAHHLAIYGIEGRWAKPPLAAWLDEVLEHPIVANRQHNSFSCEVDFVVPTHDLEKNGREIMAKILARTLGDQWIGQGFLQGVMDLVLQDAKNRWHVVDYKSNWLPSYSHDQIKDEMHAHDYDLQGLLYTLALYHQLHKVYDGQYHKFHDNFSGVHFLFIRGMDKQDVAKGVFTVRPDVRLMQSLADSWIRKNRLLS